MRLPLILSVVFCTAIAAHAQSTGVTPGTVALVRDSASNIVFTTSRGMRFHNIDEVAEHFHNLFTKRLRNTNGIILVIRIDLSEKDIQYLCDRLMIKEVYPRVDLVDHEGNVTQFTVQAFDPKSHGPLREIR